MRGRSPAKLANCGYFASFKWPWNAIRMLMADCAVNQPIFQCIDCVFIVIRLLIVFEHMWAHLLQSLFCPYSSDNRDIIL